MEKPSPPGWPRLSAGVFYDDPAAAITWLEKAFGFVTRFKVEGEHGTIAHSELLLADALIMVGTADPERGRTSPKSVDGRNTQSLLIHVDDVDAHCAQARAAGATILAEPTTTDYGPEFWSDRLYEAADPEGHRWWFAQRLRTGP